MYTVTVRPLRTDEHDAWLRMRRALFPDVDDAMHRYEMARHRDLGTGATVLVADAGGVPAGFAELTVRSRVEGSMEDRVGYLEAWWVAPPHRGSGVGRRLIAAAEQWTRDRGLVELASDADLGDDDAIAAHRAVGFRETFRIVQFSKRLDG